ncbi:MAG TPA: glycerophosphodiester phosphodiesterase [Candidatus Limnocylindrales bacterium]|nr:glycerophosphodiester phosphodiesterase [Candidatus Limnocylindrales bacterium]
MAFLEGVRPRLFAHRGSSGTMPENTLESFIAAIEAGADRIELDVHATSDGAIVVLHDESLARTTNGTSLIRETTLAQVKQLDAGHNFTIDGVTFPFRGKGITVPTLEEVLEALPQVPVNIEIKQVKPHIEESVLDVLDRNDARERVMLAAVDQRILERVRALAPDVATSFSALEVASFVSLLQSEALENYDPPGLALQVPTSYEGTEIVSPGFVDGAHELDLEVHVWTVNEESEMERLLDMGVDGLMSDYPARARQVLVRRGLR